VGEALAPLARRKPRMRGSHLADDGHDQPVDPEQAAAPRPYCFAVRSLAAASFCTGSSWGAATFGAPGLTSRAIASS